MKSPSLSLAFSPCPNDTFIFNALVNRILPDPGFSLNRLVLDDVESLNRQALKGEFDITKLSFHAYGHVQEDYALLTAGSALGRGCGPLLVAKEYSGNQRFGKIAIPGRYTTAAMLLQLYHPGVSMVEMRFDQIMANVKNGQVDAGVIIHESRFTYRDYDLVKVIDLGSWWEQDTGCPIPLGGIAIKRSLGADLQNLANSAIRSSLHWAWSHKNAGLSYIRRHSQEMAEQVITDHIDLYVNNYSDNLGAEGQRAIEIFLKRGHEADLF